MLDYRPLPAGREKVRSIPSWYYYLLSILFIVTGLILVSALQWLLYQLGFLPSDMAAYSSQHMFLVIMVQASIFLALRFIFIRVYRFKTFPLFSSGRPNLVKELLGFTGALLGLLLTYIVLGVILQLLEIKEIKQFEMLNKQALKENSTLFFITVVLVAPVYEETIFRGFLLPALAGDDENRGALFRKLLAVVFSSALFTSLHIQSGLLALIPIGVLSLYLSAVTLVKKSIYYSIALHLLQNALAAHVFLNYEQYEKLMKNLPQKVLYLAKFSFG